MRGHAQVESIFFGQRQIELVVGTSLNYLGGWQGVSLLCPNRWCVAVTDMF